MGDVARARKRLGLSPRHLSRCVSELDVGHLHVIAGNPEDPPPMAAYFLFDNVEVTDPAALARYLATAVAPEVMEGDPGLTSVVLIEFPDADSARAWYESPAYRPLKALRHRAVRNTAVLIAG